MRLSRFERRILAAMIAVALVALGGALWFGQGAVSEAYRVGMRPDVLDELESSLEVYERYFRVVRDDADRTADAVGYDRRLELALASGDRSALRRHLEEVLDRYPNVAAVAVRDLDLPEAQQVIARVERAERLDPERNRLLTLDRPAERESTIVQVTVATEAALYHQHQQAGELVEVYRRLLAGATYVSGFYVGVYVAFLLSVVVVALAVGIVVSRRVTRRVAILAEATERVGKGDLSVEVATDGGDEIAELTRAFNAMVRDIREGRDRIEYLQRMSAWQEFARRLAHEIKNPLTPIQLAMQQVHRTYDGDDARYRRTLEDALAIVEEEVATLRRLVGEFSEFARLPVAALERGDLGAFVQEALRGVDPAALLPEDAPEARPPVLAMEVAPEPMPVLVDAQMLRRALDNLVRNAVHAVTAAAPEGGGRVIVAARPEDGFALLEVRDNGPGVPAEARARVFDPYYTTKEHGTGLGLAIVKKVVLEHGGSIDCGAAPEGGAAFRLRLPLEKA